MLTQQQIADKLRERLGVDEIQAAKMTFKNGMLEVYATVIAASLKAYYVRESTLTEKISGLIFKYRRNIPWLTYNLLKNLNTKELEDLYYKVLEMEGKDIQSIKRLIEESTKKYLETGEIDDPGKKKVQLTT